MLLHRVAPLLRSAETGEPGHPLYMNPRQGAGRWDNPDLYHLLYLAHTPSGAIGETFGGIVRWTPAMLVVPGIPGSTRWLVVYSIDEEAHPCIDLDDARTLLDRGIRPTEVVIRNRPMAQAIAAGIFGEQRWSGIQWWSYQRAQWTVCALWDTAALVVESVEAIPSHPALADAARALAKDLTGF